MAASQFQLQTQYKPHIRQEGFHLPSPPPGADTPSPSDSSSLFMGPHTHSFHPDLNDELASLMSNERSTQSPGAYGDNGGPDNGYRPPAHTHNIFDISAPSAAHHQHHVGASSNGGPGSNGSGSPNGHAHGLGDAPQPGPQYHFNSTLPALNSSMRYDPHPPYIPSPSSFRSPSPHHHSRSRSRSRPPSSHLASTPAGGPTRTTRTRRNGSISSTSPPPRPVPQAIIIPGSSGNRGYTQSWFGNDYNPHATPESLPSLTSLPSLPSLGSLNSIHSHSHQQQHIGSLNSPHTLNSPHGLNSPHTLNSPHPFHQHQYSANGGYGSPVESKFGGMALNGGVGSLGGSGAMHAGMSASLPSSSGPTPQTNGAPEPTGKQSDKAALLANEKRRRRRESHNAVERRRRDNINEKIGELATLIPECMLEGAAGKKDGGDEDSKEGVKDGGQSPTSAGGSTVVKANKGMILRKSVEYIRYLQQLVTAQGARNRELEDQLKGFRGSASGSEASPPPSLGDTNDLLNGSGLGLGLGVAGVWGLASMSEENDERDLHSLDMMGMDIDTSIGMPPGPSEEKRGRKATRGAGGTVLKSKTSPRKTKKVAVALDEDDDHEGSEMSDGGMEA
ncbi:helix-loop-helix DNA-binding domain-containing protein [Mycena amicta]|nr:helix-loop-helix DNA-binding domain-containing protein [Mycena amicta]